MDFYYDDIYIKGSRLVRGGEFSLPDNGLFIITGDNGSGKTLLLNYLFQRQTKTGKKCILVDQSSNRLLLKSSVIENISFSCSECDNFKMGEELKSQDFGYLSQHLPKFMSGGEKRITCILRGIYAQPKDILFVDEPTNDLDVHIVSKLLEAIKELSKKTLVIAISHDDRILRIADGILRLEKGKLSSQTITVAADLAERKIRIDEYGPSVSKNKKIPLLKKQFGIKWSSLFLCFLFAIVTIVSSNSVVRASNNLIPNMRNDQIDIYIPVSMYAADIKESSLPIALIPFLNGESNASEFAEALRKDTSGTRSVNFTLNLPRSEKYTVYNLEYYDVFLHQNYFTAEKYFEMTGETELNTEGCFDFSFAIHNAQTNKNPMKPSQFDASVNYYENNPASNGQRFERVFCTVVMNEGYSLSDFYQSEEIKTLLDGNFYIRSNDTISILNEATTFSSQKETALLVLICSIIVLIVEFITTEIYMKLGRNNIRVFRNMSIPASYMVQNIFSAMKDRILRLISIGCVATICLGFAIYYFIQRIEIVFLFWGYCLYYIVIVMVAGVLVKIICKKKTLRCVDWRFR